MGRMDEYCRVGDGPKEGLVVEEVDTNIFSNTSAGALLILWTFSFLHLFLLQCHTVYRECVNPTQSSVLPCDL